MNVQSTRPAASTPVMSERRVALIGALMVAIGPISLAIFTPAMPEIVRTFGTTEGAVKLTLSLYFAGFALAQLVCGPVSDAYGRKPVIVGFMAIYLVATVAAILAPSIEWLIAARFAQGVGAAAGVAISRAMVRDLFTNERSARILNLIGMILGLGPSFAPTLGGITLTFADWHALFGFMLLFSIVIILVVRFAMVETVARDPSRLRPRELTRSYVTLMGNGYFFFSSLAVAGSVGTFYTQATVLPFLIMDGVGLTPTQFGLAMLMQSGSFFIGGLTMRKLLLRRSAFALVPAGLAFIGTASLLLAVGLRVGELSFLTIMGPVAIYAFGIAFVMPAMSTAALAPFPQMAGAAASLSGFMQMGIGLIGSAAAAWLGDPLTAMSTIIPLMGLTAILSWLAWRRYPEPALARVTIPAE